jgi:hypothetical protein
MNATGMKHLRLDQAEIICRMIEAFAQTPRPEGVTAEQAVALLPASERACWLRASEAAYAYVNEQMELAMLTHYPPMSPGQLH